MDKHNEFSRCEPPDAVSNPDEMTLCVCVSPWLGKSLDVSPAMLERIHQAFIKEALAAAEMLLITPQAPGQPGGLRSYAPDQHVERYVRCRKRREEAFALAGITVDGVKWASDEKKGDASDE